MPRSFSAAPPRRDDNGRSRRPLRHVASDGAEIYGSGAGTAVRAPAPLSWKYRTMSRVPPPTIGDTELLGLVVAAEFGEGDADASARLADVLGIGGASVRERGCQCVWGLGGAGTLK